MTKAKESDKVRVHYEGKLESGHVFDSSRERDPIEFVLGEMQLIAPFETAIIGMEPGEKKTIKIECKDAYGEHQKELLFAVEREKFPEDIKIEIGMQLDLPLEDGETLQTTIIDLSENIATLDANHPLAGQRLIFELELMEIV